MEIEEELEHVNTLLKDMAAYNPVEMKRQQVQLQKFISRLEANNNIKQIQRQLRYTKFEDNFFGQLNEYKKKSMAAQKQ